MAVVSRRLSSPAAGRKWDKLIGERRDPDETDLTFIAYLMWQ